MISKEQFEKIESEHGCGYWELCWEHACPCAITTENKGLQEKIYNGFIEENKRLSEEYDDIEIPHYETCRQCGNLFEEFELTCGLCFECYEENENYESEAEL